MKLSEAMKLGAMLRPQGFIGNVRPSDPRDGTCALQAALEAIGIVNRPPHMTSVKHWPWTMRHSRCPACGEDGDVNSLVGCLNDKDRWTREQIAGWIATIEPAETPEVTPDAVEVEVA